MFVRKFWYKGIVDNTDEDSSYRRKIDSKGTKKNSKNLGSGDNDAAEREFNICGVEKCRYR